MLAGLLTSSDKHDPHDRTRKYADIDSYQDEQQRKELINILRSDSTNRRQTS